jgi:hypothetical protein
MIAREKKFIRVSACQIKYYSKISARENISTAVPAIQAGIAPPRVGHINDTDIINFINGRNTYRTTP